MFGPSLFLILIYDPDEALASTFLVLYLLIFIIQVLLDVILFEFL